LFIVSSSSEIIKSLRYDRAKVDLHLTLLRKFPKDSALSRMSWKMMSFEKLLNFSNFSFERFLKEFPEIAFKTRHVTFLANFPLKSYTH
jgi:hypothetical protein